MMIRKMTFVIVLATEGVVLGSGLEMRVALQEVLQIRQWDVGAGFLDVSVVVVCAGV